MFIYKKKIVKLNFTPMGLAQRPAKKKTCELKEYLIQFHEKKISSDFGRDCLLCYDFIHQAHHQDCGGCRRAVL